MPKVSVIMPVYNGEAYLSEAIQSIINQTLEDWEFIIVNEFGSNEKTTAILQDFAAQDARIRIIQNKDRLRIAESLNVGIRHAQGQYIARMDADDIAGKDRLALQVEFMEKHPDIDICGLKVDMFGEHTWDWQVYDNPKYLQCATLFYTPFVHPTIMMRANSLRRENLEYNADFFYTEDYEFFERAAYKLKFTNLVYPGCYRYRYVSTNATNVGGNEGVRLQNQVMRRAFKRWGLEFTNDQIRLLSPNAYPHAFDSQKAQDDLTQLDLLLKEIFLCDTLRRYYSDDLLFQVLHRRWMDAYESYRWQSEVMDDGQVERAICRGLFFHEHFYSAINRDINNHVPRVSVVIPTYNSENYIMDTMYSLLEQDFENTEILVVNEATTSDRTVKCIKLFKDPRIQIIQNTDKLGLAESLNKGIKEARGEYIARADADDVYPVDRISKQVKFLDSNPEISIYGSWQRHFGKRNYIHQPPTSKEEMKASLLFRCEVCHSTVMFRRKDILSLGKLYDSSYLSEDYELWSRAAQTLNFATIPEVLGEYRWNGENITVKKMDLLDTEAQRIVRRNIEQSLGLQIPDEDLILLSGWKNPFECKDGNQKALQEREKRLLDQIEAQNKQMRIFDQTALKKVLDRRRVWAGIKHEAVLTEAKQIMQGQKKNVLKILLKKILKPIYQPIRKRIENRLIAIQESAWKQEGIVAETLQKIQDMDGHLYDYFYSLNECVIVQQQQLTALQGQLGEMQRHILNLEEILNHVPYINRNEDEQCIASLISKAKEEIQQSINSKLDSTSVSIENNIQSAERKISQATDTRIWNAEKLINQTTDSRIWKMEKQIKKQLREGFQNVYWANCLNGRNDKMTSSMIYDDVFYFENRAGSIMSARAVLSVILSSLKCNSIVDFGCGTGTWLWVAQNFGVESILGLDGEYVHSRQLMIPKACFRATNLEEPVKLDQRYDLAMSLEVAEHLHEQCADIFVTSLCNAADVVLFSAAHPGQGGDGHINEQPMEYWERKFAMHGYKPIQIKCLFENDEDVENWYKENVVLFVCKAKMREVEPRIM